MGIKVVRFKDGTYGVRKWVFMEGYQFLDMSMYDKNWDQWWSIDRHVDEFAKAPSELIAIAKLEAWKERMSRKNDKGTPL